MIAAAAAPRISVVMPVYNGEKFVVDAIESILAQTYTDFELIVIDDGSEDKTVEQIEKLSDKRIRLVQNPYNQGLVASLNIGIKLSNGEFIARMDHDDISVPLRFEKQVQFLDQHHDVGVLGSNYEAFGSGRNRIVHHPVEDAEIRNSFLHTGCVLAHPTVMMRASVLRTTGLRYDEAFKHAEDFRLWAELSAHTKLHNLPEVLLRYRVHSTQVSQVHQRVQAANSARVRSALLNSACPLLSAAEKALALDLFDDNVEIPVGCRPAVVKLLKRLCISRLEDNAFSKRTILSVARQLWYSFHRRNLGALEWRAPISFLGIPSFLLCEPYKTTKNFAALVFRAAKLKKT